MCGQCGCDNCANEVNHENEVMQYVTRTSERLKIVEDLGDGLVKAEKIKNNKKVGIFIARKMSGDMVAIGFSFCSPKENGFNKNHGMKVAERRLNAYYNKMINGDYDTIVSHIPYKYRNDFREFVTRCKKYYKDAVIPEWVDMV